MVANALRLPESVERRPPQFSLRMLMAAVLVVGLTCSGVQTLGQMVLEKGVLVDLYNYPKAETSFGTIVRLEVYGTKLPLTDQAFARLPTLRNLEHLVICEHPITDATLSRLSSLRKLKRLILARTNVSQSGVDELRRRLPDCEIDWTP